jgi:hypothetical protein
MKKVIKKQSINPVLVEVPTPVNQMTTAEKNAFADQMLDALLGKESKNGSDNE